MSSWCSIHMLSTRMAAYSVLHSVCAMYAAAREPPLHFLQTGCALLHRFGVSYASSCNVDLSALLAQLDYSSNGPRFYDPYLQQASAACRPWSAACDRVNVNSSSVVGHASPGRVTLYQYHTVLAPAAATAAVAAAAGKGGLSPPLAGWLLACCLRSGALQSHHAL